MTATRKTGRAWVFGDNVDTDALAPGLYMRGPIEELARHCLETIDPEFAECVQPGDVVAAGRNFGMGSSREQAVQALKHLGVAAVVAPSFAGIFYRNAFNNGLPALVCAEAAAIRTGERVAVEFDEARIALPDRGLRMEFDPIAPHLARLIAAGGLVPYLEQHFAEQRKESAT